MTYTADTQKLRGRFVPCVQGVVLAAVVATVGMVFREGMTFQETVPTDNTGWTLLLVSLAILLASVAAAIWSSRYLPTTQNLLTVDRHGLTLMTRGQSRRWRWADISPVRLEGTVATFTAEAGEERSNGRIRDIYPTRLAEIVARINDYRDRAVAGGESALGADAPDAGPSAPARFHIDAATQKRQRLKEFGWFLLSMMSLPILYYFLIREMHSEFLGIFASFEMIIWVFIAFLVTGSLILMVFMTGRSGNFLQITDEGLTWSRRLTAIRQWKWQDISSFEVRDGADRKSSGGRAIAFMAADDGKPFRGMGLSSALLVRPASPGLLSFTFDDTYDAPLDRIAEHLNASRDRALADTPPERIIEAPSAKSAGYDGRPVNFQQDVQSMGRMGVVGWALAFGCVVWLPAIVILGFPFEVPGGMEGWAQSPGQWLLRFLSMLPMIAIIAELLFLMREIMPADNALTLDRYGLTLTRGGRKKVWAWRDLSDFAVDARKVLGLFGPRGVVVFEAPGGHDLRSRFLRWCYRLTGHAPAFVIEDVYNTPIDDIASVLNRYRAEGASGGAVPG
ncbi:MAG: hypothetical protein HKM95_14665 [Inquilinus sp.]|nr:hypothetical protein [Inquilinus sp.]